MYLTYGKRRKQKELNTHMQPQLTCIFEVSLSLSKEECTVI